MGAFAGAVLLTVSRQADDREAIRKMPWGVNCDGLRRDGADGAAG